MGYNQAKRIVSFRLSEDTPDEIFSFLNEEKERHGRKFNGELAQILIHGLYERLYQQAESLVIPLPEGLTEKQKQWLQEPTSRQILGQWLYQMLSGSLQPISLDSMQQEEKVEEFQLSLYHQRLASANFFDEDE